MLTDKKLEQLVQARYAGWEAPWAQDIMTGKMSLDAVANGALERNVDVLPVSGRQEHLENLLNSYI
jgi:xylose isomerase